MHRKVDKMKILVTGANGFIGSHLISVLSKNNNIDALALVRYTTSPPQYSNVEYVFGDILNTSAWQHKLEDVDVVVHTAGRAHIMLDTATDPLSEFRKINTDATITLANIASSFGVRRFVYVSSLKVHGEYTEAGRAFTNQSRFDPHDPYAISKCEAETELNKLNMTTNLETVIIRPPLVYGTGVKGNFEKLMKVLTRKIPLPFAGIRNARSLVSLENLVDVICVCLNHPNAKNKAFLVSDGVDLSTAELVNNLALSGGYNGKIFTVPPSLLKFFFKITRRESLHDRLCRSLVADISYTCDQLDWKPSFDKKTAFKSVWLKD